MLKHICGVILLVVVFVSLAGTVMAENGGINPLLDVPEVTTIDIN